jgi:hypothetical protein
MADALVTTVILLTENIRGCLQRAEKANDILEIRSVLAEIEQNLNLLIDSAKAVERDNK